MSTKQARTSKKASSARGLAKRQAPGAATEKLRKAALAEIQARINGKAKPPVGKAKRGKAGTKPTAPPKPKKVSLLDAAAKVLADRGKPMRAKELVEAVIAKGLWSSPQGKTPHATLFAAMIREITAKKGEARFKKIDRGLFEATGKGA